MGAKRKVLHEDDFSIYEAQDLDYFQDILDDIVSEYGTLGSLPLGDIQYLRVQLAAAIFRSAAAGERNYARLKQSAIEAVSAVPSDLGSRRSRLT
jgi:hypothetical protein